MGKASPALAAFNAGEFAPQMEGRTDVEKYPNACHIAQNFISLKQGPAMFRPGTAYVQPVKASANRSWLVRFEYSQTQAYVIEFGNLYLRFYTNHGPLLCQPAAYSGAAQYAVGQSVLQGGVVYGCIAVPPIGTAPPNAAYWYPMTAYQGSVTTAIYEIPSPYLAADLTDALGQFTLQVEQSGDVLYIAGGVASTVTSTGYAPMTLTRYANAPPDWILATYAPIDGPFSPGLPVVPNGNVALGVSAVQGQAVTCFAFGGSPFAATDVGRLVRIASQTYNTPQWQTNIAITAGSYCSNGGQNYQALNAATTGAEPPVHTAGAVADGVNGGVQWLWVDSGYGVGQITAFANAAQVTLKVLKRFPVNTVYASANITGITQANPCVITAAQTFLVASPVFVTGVSGMTQLNGNAYTNGPANAASVTLAGVDSTSFSAWTSGGQVVANVSYEWQLGAWSNTTEWPRAVAFFKDRLFWAGRLFVWGSVPGQYTSHAPDQFGQVVTSSAMNNLISGADASGVTWLSSALILLIGTQGGEYGLDAASQSAPLGPANVEVLRQSKWRSRPLTPQLCGTSVVYVQRAGRRVQAMDYNFYLNRYDSTDQSKFAYHITIGGIIQIAYQAEPFSIVWAVRSDGTLLSYTYNREDNVTAWNRHNLGGSGIVESIAVIPAPDGLRDELWMIVRRTINGATVRSVEYLAKHYEGPQAGNVGDAQSSAWYLDCAAQSVATPAPGATTTTVTGLAYLTGQTVGILADGGVQPQQVVPAGGSITLTGAFTTVTVGLPYQGNLVPMRIEGGADTGTAQGKLKQGASITVRLVDSGNGLIAQLNTGQIGLTGYSSELGQLTLTPLVSDAIRQNDTSTALGSPPPIMSGDFPLSFPHNPVTDQDASDFYILIQQNDPLPMTVVGLYPDYKVEERQ